MMLRYHYPDMERANEESGCTGSSVPALDDYAVGWSVVAPTLFGAAAPVDI